MKTKLTLSIEKEVIEEARAILKKEGQSLSKTFEEYLKNLISMRNKEEKYSEAEEDLLPEVRELAGIFKTDRLIDPEEVKWKYLQEKYGLND